MMLIQPRDYQIIGHNGLWGYFTQHTGNPVVAMPTGTGKSVNIAMFAYAALQSYPSTRIMALTHVKELISQNFRALQRVWPEAPAGIYSSGLKKRDTSSPITFGGVASVVRHIDDFRHIDLVVIDECHMLPPPPLKANAETEAQSNPDAMYHRIIDALKSVNPYVKVVGFTASPWRMGHGLITSPGSIFTDFAVDMTSMQWYNWFVEQGYLTKLVTLPTNVGLDTSGVGMSQGDYNQRELNEKLAGQDKEHYQACAEIVRHGADRRKWLIFTAGVERAEWVADVLNSMGVAATFVHSKMDDPGGKIRDERIADYRKGLYRAMVGNNIFTTGFDDPEIDLIGMLRPSKSVPLWVQMLGRGGRPLYAGGFDLTTVNGRLWAIQAGGKANCLVLDFARNTMNLGPVNDPVIPKRKGESAGDIPVKICGECGCYNHLAARVCDNCGAAFPIGQKLTHEAFKGDIIRTEEPVLEWFNVSTVIYRKHQKGGGRPSVRVTYSCGFRAFDEWVFIEHEGYLGKKARDWWRTRANMAEVPPNADEFIKYKHLLKWPKKIQVQTNKPYPEVIRYEYE
jgi:DNA repair protein RadD